MGSREVCEVFEQGVGDGLYRGQGGRVGFMMGCAFEHGEGAAVGIVIRRRDEVDSLHHARFPVLEGFHGLRWRLISLPLPHTQRFGELTVPQQILVKSIPSLGRPYWEGQPPSLFAFEGEMSYGLYTPPLHSPPPTHVSVI